MPEIDCAMSAGFVDTAAIKDAATFVLKSLMDKGQMEVQFCIGEQSKCDAKDYGRSIPGAASSVTSSVDTFDYGLLIRYCCHEGSENR